MTEKHERIEIDSINKISEIVDSLKKNNKRILLIFDIDDTLIKPKGKIGSELWFTNNLEKYDNDWMKILDDVFYLYSLLFFDPVEADTKNVVDKLISDPGTEYMFLTARSYKFYSHTLKHLEESGMESLIKSNTLHVPLEIQNVGKLDPKFKVRYIDNICLVSGNDKNLVLIELLKQHYTSNTTSDPYDAIVFVDDSDSNITKMHNTFESHDLFKNVSTRCVHYTYMKQHRQEYSVHDFTDDNDKMHKLMEFKHYINNVKKD